MTHALKPISVAIGDLVAHPANVRNRSPESYASENIAHLKASIAVLGLLQPLLVQKIDGKFGVHLRSNGIDGTTTRIVTTERADPSHAFAEGINPFRDPDWMAARQAAFRDLTGQFYTDILDDLQMLIDRGHDTIRLATDGHTIRVFLRRAADYLIGGTYDVPSGLGGTFRVILRDATDTHAIVQNHGNCEDFDEMLPYRVPLDALIEIDDRRAA